MSDPRWRDTRPSRPYGSEPGGRPPGRDTRGSDPRRRGAPADDAATRRIPAQTGLTQPIAPQPAFHPRSGETSRRAAGGPGKRRGRKAGGRPPGGRLSRIWQGSLRGGLGICVIVGSALIGAIATIVTHNQPGSALGLFVLAGTVAAALTVQPRTGRMIFPVPALSYLIAALAAGVAYDRSADKTQIAVGAAQWIASGFFVMVLSTLLAIALTTVRWFMWRRDQRGPDAPDWSPQPATAPRPQPGPARPQAAPRSRAAPRSQEAQPGTQPAQRPPASPWEQRPGPRPDQQPGSGPYNFSRGA
jgi:hypothetical protein